MTIKVTDDHAKGRKEVEKQNKDTRLHKIDLSKLKDLVGRIPWEVSLLGKGVQVAVLPERHRSRGTRASYSNATEKWEVQEEVRLDRQQSLQ